MKSTIIFPILVQFSLEKSFLFPLSLHTKGKHDTIPAAICTGMRDFIAVPQEKEAAVRREYHPQLRLLPIQSGRRRHLPLLQEPYHGKRQVQALSVRPPDASAKKFSCSACRPVLCRRIQTVIQSEKAVAQKQQPFFMPPAKTPAAPLS